MTAKRVLRPKVDKSHLVIEIIENRGIVLLINGKGPDHSWSCGDDEHDEKRLNISNSYADRSPLVLAGIGITGYSYDVPREWDISQPPTKVILHTDKGDIEAIVTKVLAGNPDEEYSDYILINGKRRYIDECSGYVQAVGARL